MSGLVRWSRAAFNAVAWVFAGCVVVQLYLAGLGVFDRAQLFITHRDFGYLFGALTLLLIVLAVAGRLPRGIVVTCVGLAVLFALQSVFVVLRTSLPTGAALHVLNGVLILVVAGALAWTTRGLLREARGTA